MLNDTGTRLTLALLGVLAVVAIFIVVRDKRETDAEAERRQQGYVCALQAERGLPQDEDC